MELPASTTSYVTITNTITDVIPSTTVVITATGPDPGYRNVTVTEATTVGTIIPIYTLAPVPSLSPTFTAAAACTPTSELKTLSEHYSYDCYCDCGSSTTDAVWWGTDWAHQLTTSWCTFQPSTLSPAIATTAPESYTSVFTGCAVAMPLATPLCAAPAPMGDAMDLVFLAEQAEGACAGTEGETSGGSSFPLNGDEGGVVLQNGEYYAFNVAPDTARDYWLNFSLSWSNTSECDDVPSQVMPGRSMCVGIFNQSYYACQYLILFWLMTCHVECCGLYTDIQIGNGGDANLQTGCVNWTLVEGLP